MTLYSEPVTQDCAILQQNPLTNYDGFNLQIGYVTGKTPIATASLVERDFSALDITAAEVDSAYFYLYCFGLTGAPEITFYRVTVGWQEINVTWNTKPAEDWTVLSDTVIPVTDEWAQWTITDMIKDAITNRSKIWSAVGYCQAEDVDAGFLSKEVNPGLCGYIEINYTVAGVAAKAYVMVF